MILKDHTITPEDFELVKENKYGRSVFIRSTSGNLGKPGAEYQKVLIRTS